MKKKTIILIFSVLIIPVSVFANDTAKSSIVIDLNSGRTLYEKNSDEKRLIASITKIMTAILTIENGILEDKVEVGTEILNMYGTNIYLEVGEEISIRDLLYGLILRSGNDASVVLAKYIGGTEKEFIELMNEKAKQIGMANTTFSNPHGLDDDTKNYSTARDMSILSKYAYQNKTYRKIASTKTYKTRTNKKNYIWNNRNKLLSKYEFCTGGKNGYTPTAGKTLITTSKKNNLELSAVTLNDSDIYNNHYRLYEEIYKKYRQYTIIDKDKFKFSTALGNTKNLYLTQSFTYPLTEKEFDLIKIKIEIIDEKNRISNKIGKVIIFLNEETIGNLNIYEKKEKAKTFSLKKSGNYFLEILKKLKLGLQNNLKPGLVVPIPLDTNNLAAPIL